MIVVDTSALMAIILGEPQAEACADVLQREAQVFISAGTLAEALIVSTRRGFDAEMNGIIQRLKLEILPVTAATARRVAAAYDEFGKGRHPAALNFADCFAYEAARTQNCPLLYVGEDFRRTDVADALTA